MARALIAAACLCLAACAGPQTSSASFVPAATSWRRSDDADANPHGATLEFGPTRASGFTGCNRWFADFTHSATRLRFGPIVLTRMACLAEVEAATERHFVGALERTRGFHLEGEELVLTDADNQTLARFTCEHAPCPGADE